MDLLKPHVRSVGDVASTGAEHSADVVPVWSSVNLTRNNLTTALKSFMSRSGTGTSGQLANLLLTTPTLALLGGPVTNLDDEELTQENLAMQSLTKLKDHCKILRLDYSMCREKSDLVDLLKLHIPRSSMDLSQRMSRGHFRIQVIIVDWLVGILRL